MIYVSAYQVLSWFQKPWGFGEEMLGKSVELPEMLGKSE